MVFLLSDFSLVLDRNMRVSRNMNWTILPVVIHGMAYLQVIEMKDLVDS